MTDTLNRIRTNFNASVQTKMLTLDTLSASIDEAAHVLLSAFLNNNQLLICGNGGSAADAQHFAAEMIKFKIRFSTRNFQKIKMTC